MRVLDLLLYQGTGSLERLPAWWEDIDEDPEWQEWSFVVLSATYGLVALVALVQLCRIQSRTSDYGWTVYPLYSQHVNLFGYFQPCRPALATLTCQ